MPTCSAAFLSRTLATSSPLAGFPPTGSSIVCSSTLFVQWTKHSMSWHGTSNTGYLRQGGISSFRKPNQAFHTESVFIQSIRSSNATGGLAKLPLHFYHPRSEYSSNPFNLPTTSVTACMDEELHTRTRVFPSKVWMATLRYALGLHLKNSELEALEPAIEAAMQSVALTRDYWSWPCDSRSAINNKRVTNAVAITMVERNCSEEMAMAAVKNAAMTAENRFLQRKLELLEGYGKGHSEAVMFLDAVEHFAAGNSLWCSTCPLYHGRR